MPDQPDDELVDRLVQAAFVVTAVLTRVAAETELSLTQLRVLGILRDRRLTVSVLAGYLGLEKSTMSGLVARAEKRGLLARDVNVDDGRAVDVLITGAGSQLVEGLFRRAQEELAPLATRLGAAEQRRLGALLGQLLGGPD